jgi:hypothetical protein
MQSVSVNAGIAPSSKLKYLIAACLQFFTHKVNLANR